LLDLSHWLEGEYRVAVSETDEMPDEDEDTSYSPED